MLRSSDFGLFAVALGACADTTAGTSSPAEGSEGNRLHSTIMQAVTSYPTLNDPKVMSGCISNRRGRSPQIKVHNVFTWYTDVSSDTPIFSGRLGNNALQSCRGWAAGENVDCTCVLIDNSGTNVIDLSQVPATGQTSAPSKPAPETDASKKPKV